MARQFRGLRAFRLPPTVVAVFGGLALWAGSAAAQDSVPGRLLVELTDAGTRAYRAGRLDLPVPPGGEALDPRLEPLFRTREGRLGRIFLYTFRADRAPVGSAAADNDAWMRALDVAPDVLRAESDRVLALSALPDDPYLLGAPLDGDPAARQFHLVNPGGLSTNASRAWPFVPAGGAVIVAILDSGVDWRHPDLGGAAPPETGVLWRNEAELGGAPGFDDDGNGFIDDEIGWDFVDVAVDLPAENRDAREDAVLPDNDPSDFAGHGTQVAGLVTAITGNTLGLAGAPAGTVRLMPIRVGWARTTGASVVWMSYCARGIEYAALMGAGVANCSWDSINGFGLGAALDFAILEHDMVVVGSAGNGGTSSTSIQYLASRADCLGVAALLESGAKAGFSNFGPWVDVAAFGKGMVTAQFDRNGGVSSYIVNASGGTSFSAPIVSAQAALLRAIDPAADAATIRAAIVESARPLHDVEPTFASQLGGGLADMAAAARRVSGGWERELRAWGLLPVPGRGVAVQTDDGIALLRAADGATLWGPLPEAGIPASRLLPALAVAEAGDTLLLADDGAALHAFTLDGTARPGFPVALPGAAHALLAADLDRDGADEILVAGADSLVVFAADGSERWRRGVALRGLTAGPLDPSRPGWECAGPDAAGAVRAFDAAGSPLAWDGVDLELDAVAPIAVEFDGGGAAALILAASPSGAAPETRAVHALLAGAAPAGFPVSWTGPPVVSLSGTGSALAQAVSVVAVDAEGEMRVVAANGSVSIGGAGAPLAGDPLAVDLDGDAAGDLSAVLVRGELRSWDGSLLPRSDPTRYFPNVFAETAVCIDSGDRRRFVAADTAGAVWGIPLGPAGGAAPWPAARGGASRSGYLSFARATPAEPSGRLTWTADADGPGGRLCWSGVDSAVLRLRIREASVASPAWEGAAVIEGCASLPGAADGEWILEGVGRDGEWRELARTAVTSLTPRVGLPAPNPFRGEVRIPLAGLRDGATITVWDVRGRVLARSAVPPGERVATWDGRDASGRDAAAGWYLVGVRYGDSIVTRRVLRLPR